MEVCKEQDYKFIDNDKVFLNDGRPDVSLYRNPLHLNKKGGKVFGQNIQETLIEILHIPQGETRLSPDRKREATQFQTQNSWFPPNHHIPQGETRQSPIRQREATQFQTQNSRFPPNHHIPQGETRQSPIRQREATQFQTQDFRFPPNHHQGNQQNRMIPQFMPFYPPWFPAPPQQFLQNWK